MDEENKKINLESFFKRVDSVEQIANSALSKANSNLGINNNQKSLIESLSISIEAMQTKIRDIANYIIVERKIEADREEDRRLESEDAEQKKLMTERATAMGQQGPQKESVKPSESQGGGGSFLGGLVQTLGGLMAGGFALKYIGPVLLPKLLLLAKTKLFPLIGTGLSVAVKSSFKFLGGLVTKLFSPLTTAPIIGKIFKGIKFASPFLAVGGFLTSKILDFFSKGGKGGGGTGVSSGSNMGATDPTVATDMTDTLEKNDLIENDNKQGEFPSEEKISLERGVSNRFDMDSGRAYINEKEVSFDEYNEFQNMSDSERVQKYGQTESFQSEGGGNENNDNSSYDPFANEIKPNLGAKDGDQISMITEKKSDLGEKDGFELSGAAKKLIGGDKPFLKAIEDLSEKRGINQSQLLGLIASESSFDPKAVNKDTGATGLIQFMPEVAESLGTTTDEIQKMSRAEQVKLIDKYFDMNKLPDNPTAGQLKTNVLMPAYTDKSDDFELMTKNKQFTDGEAGNPNTYSQNKGLDYNEDGFVTVGEAGESVTKKMKEFGIRDLSVEPIKKELDNLSLSLSTNLETSDKLVNAASYQSGIQNKDQNSSVVVQNQPAQVTIASIKKTSSPVAFIKSNKNKFLSINETELPPEVLRMIT